jgi:hypothetical protein
MTTKQVIDFLENELCKRRIAYAISIEEFKVAAEWEATYRGCQLHEVTQIGEKAKNELQNVLLGRYQKLDETLKILRGDIKEEFFTKEERLYELHLIFKSRKAAYQRLILKKAMTAHDAHRLLLPIEFLLNQNLEETQKESKPTELFDLPTQAA